MVTVAGGIILAVLILLFLPVIFRLIGWGILLVGVLLIAGFVYLLGVISPNTLTILLFSAVLIAGGYRLINFLPKSWEDVHRKSERSDRPAPGSREYLDWANRRGKWSE
ncbi:MAG: hypothetical protein KF765_06630 [Parvibaculaceae bacterium]|nr:hypothetical protein [Parvibaculaceae bacterium]